MMLSDVAPDPDSLLASIQSQERQEKSGKLFIFFGMAAGVGKTVAMLQAAHDKKKEGVDVVIGIVVTHGRLDTLKLVEGIPTIPQK